MLLRLLLLFTIVPTIELVLLVFLATRISLQFTIGLILLTGLVGAALARHEGLRCLRRIQEQLSAGRVPGNPLMDGMMILIAGALLVTPGVLTDLVGFALLLPPFRGLIRRYVKGRFEANIRLHMPAGGWPTAGDWPPTGDQPPHDRIIDTKVIEED
jgi:UPF0716 protein FxsA